MVLRSSQVYPSTSYAPLQPDLRAISAEHAFHPSVRSHYRKQASPLHQVIFFLVALAILFGLFQSFRAIITGASKLAALVSNSAAVERSYQASIAENRLLRQRIGIYSAPAGIEELARNNLEMVGDGEILVRTH